MIQHFKFSVWCLRNQYIDKTFALISTLPPAAEPMPIYTPADEGAVGFASCVSEWRSSE